MERFLWTQTINQLKHARPPYNEKLLHRHCLSPVRSFVSARLLLTKKRNMETFSVISANRFGILFLDFELRNTLRSHSMPPVLARRLQNSSPVVRATKNTPPRAQLASATALMAKTVSSPIGMPSSIGALAMSAKLGFMKTASLLKYAYLNYQNFLKLYQKTFVRLPNKDEISFMCTKCSQADLEIVNGPMTLSKLQLTEQIYSKFKNSRHSWPLKRKDIVCRIQTSKSIFHRSISNAFL